MPRRKQSNPQPVKIESEDGCEQNGPEELVLQSDIMLGQDLKFESSDKIMGFGKDSKGSDSLEFIHANDNGVFSPSCKRLKIGKEPQNYVEMVDNQMGSTPRLLDMLTDSLADSPEQTNGLISQNSMEANVDMMLGDHCSFEETSLSSDGLKKTQVLDGNLYKCPDCSYTSNQLSKIKCHFLIHKGQKPSQFDNASDQLETPIHAETPKKTIKCGYCDFACDRVITLTRHKRKHVKNKAALRRKESSISNKFLQTESTVGSEEKKFYNCSYCSYTSSLMGNLQRHIRIHLGEKPFKCDQCYYATGQSGNLKRHKLTHTQKKSFTCTQCDYASGQMGNLKRHMLIHTRKKSFKCSQCDYTGDSMADLMRHKQNHKDDKSLLHNNEPDVTAVKASGEEKPYKCLYCSYASPLLGNLQRHTRIHLGEKPFKCDKCDYSSCQMGNLKRHSLTHTREKMFKCHQCGYSCGNLLDLKQHKQTHIKGKLQQDEGNPVQDKSSITNKASTHTPEQVAPKIGEEKPYKCLYCDYTSLLLGNLQRHTRIHLGEKPFKCDQCDYATYQSGHLKRHRQTHVHKKSLKCRLCDYVCNNMADLKQHQQEHTEKTASGEKKPYKCTYCNYVSSLSGNLQRHIRIHLGEKPFKCDQCEYASHQSGNLKRHVLTHSRPKSFKCGICYYNCSTAVELKEHKESHVKKELLVEDDANGNEKAQGLYSCKLCSFVSEYSGHLMRHMKTHNSEKPYKCHYCNYATVQQGNLKRHILIHTGEKPFRCSECNYTCSRMENLKRHKLIHAEKTLSGEGSSSLKSEKPYCCVLCNFKAQYPSILTRHVKTHADSARKSLGTQRSRTGKKPFHCEKCTYSTNSVIRWRVHLQNHMDDEGELQCKEEGECENVKKYFSCNLCDFITQHANNLIGHMKTHSTGSVSSDPQLPSKETVVQSSENIFSCKLCSFVTQYPNHFIMHMKTHMKTHSNSKSEYQCSHCSYTTKQSGNFKRHIQVHLGVRPFKCNKCNYASINFANLKRHLQTHLKQASSQLDSSSSQTADLDQPENISIKKEKENDLCLQEDKLENVPEPPSCESSGSIHSHVARNLKRRRQYKCSHCYYETIELGNLNRHIRSHKGEKPFKCNQCNYASTQLVNVKRHLRTHAGKESYQCTQCEFVSESKAAFKRHTDNHLARTEVKREMEDGNSLSKEQKVFSCSLCNFVSQYQSNLIRHMNIHNYKRPYKCSQCNYVSAQLGNLKRHMRNHIKKETFQCDQCNYSCASMTNLKRHAKIHTS
ncbi:zinc finger protein 729-like isoform X1 [Stegostoma tigrinum]|uniref:zinc finger protein 729-like isoform X1 n=1 Tax=Stegostoma tigrinum TaxID=3053191 RepID=UPI00202B00A0|nr:zinc finger protein 729-like isoform X1 [Stegostoma tigrinum]